MKKNYLKLYLRLIVSAFFVFLSSLAVNWPAAATELTILYTGDANGEIESCG
jgi:hypothetical protein